jgi:hypothetical protein
MAIEDIWFAGIDEDGFVAQFEMVTDEAEGPILPIQGPFTYQRLAEQPALPPQPTPACKVRLLDGVPQWVETASLAELVADAIAQIDGAADAARMAVLSRQTNIAEYQRAEPQARGFAAAGYPVDAVPSSVASWASAKWRDGWSARQAADDIIATADTWYGLLDGIRDLRLHAKEDVRHAADAGETATRVATFETDLSNLMKGST